MKKNSQALISLLCGPALLIPMVGHAQDDLLNLPEPPSGTTRYASYAEIEKDWPSAHGEGSVCFWGEDKFAAVSLTIDDNNYPDVSFWQGVSAEFDWKLTWFLIVYPYMWDIYNDVSGSNLGYNGTAEQWKVLYDQGHEIGLHGSCSSMNELDEAAYEEHILLSKAHLESAISNNIVSFAYPCGTVDSPTVQDGYRNVCSNIFIGARGTQGGSTSPFTGDYMNTYSMGDSFNQDRFDRMEDNTRPLLYSSYRGWAVFLWHGLLGDTNKIAGVYEVLDYLDANRDKYWVKPFGEVARYAQERESSTLTVNSVSADQITFSLTDRMTNTVFNYPLTVKFRVDDWGDAAAVQNGSEIPVSLLTVSNVTYALVDAVPDQGTVTLTKAAAAAFTVDPVSGWNPLTVTFTDISTLVGITNRVWDFGDGSTTNTAVTNVTHAYTAAGNYDVQLVIETPDGSSTNVQAGLITVIDPVAPTAGFTLNPSTGSVPLTVTFSDISSGDITNRIWDFGDSFSMTTTSTSVQHTYSAAGTCTVALTTQGPAGSDTNIQVDAVSATPPVPPAALFGADPTSGSVPLTVTFTDHSTGSITNRFWDFGDGTTTNTVLTSFDYTYTAAGTSSVQLVASGLAGVDTNLQAGLIVATNPPPPSGVVQINGDAADQTIGLDESGVPTLAFMGGATVSSGDDNFSSGQGECCGILVFQLPDLEGKSIVAANLTVEFEADYIRGVGTLPDVGDVVTPKWVDLYAVRYNSENTVLTNDYGYKAVGTANGTLIQTQFLYQAASEAMDPVMSTTDDVGDAALATWLQAQYNAGAQAGDYVFLRMHAAFASDNPFKTSSGDSTTPPVLLISVGEGEPSASFSATPESGEVPLTVTFSDASTVSGITDRAWDFGDGTTTNTALSSIDHTYTTAGVYSVELVVTGSSGSYTNLQADLITATNLPTDEVWRAEITSDTADSFIGVDTTLGLKVGWVSDDEMNLGDDNPDYGKANQCAIVVFALPDLGGEIIGSANLAIHMYCTGSPGGSDPFPKGVDLYGVRTASSPTVLTNDYGFKSVGSGTLIQDNVISLPINAPYSIDAYSTDADGDAALAAWLIAQYDAGAQPGDYVFLRYQLDGDTSTPLLLPSGNDTDYDPPTLTIVGAGNSNTSVPPTSLTVSLEGSGSFGTGRDVLNWTPVQGSGYVYSVWYTTNLMESFQPLETNLADTIHSITNTISAPAVFYKIEWSAQN